jgi:hypothetical protein
MAGSDWLHYAMVFLDVLLVVGSVGVGIGALQYEFQYESETAEPDDWDRPLYQYEREAANGSCSRTVVPSPDRRRVRWVARS